MLNDPEWADVISSKIWTSPIGSPKKGTSFAMDVDWKNKGILQGYLEELWEGLKALKCRFHVYTKLKQG